MMDIICIWSWILVTQVCPVHELRVNRYRNPKWGREVGGTEHMNEYLEE